MNRIGRVVLALVLVVGITYFGYIGLEGSRRLVYGHDVNTDCRTPSALGIPYEAINYDIETDAALLAREADPFACSAPGAPAGDDVVTSDGVRLAGWYVPAASGIGPHGPTVVLVHGWNDNKSGLLEDLPFFHERYNAVLFDLRNTNQSARSQTTQGIHEQRDVSAMLDWLVAAKGPDVIVLWGQSMGGHTAANVAADDPRVDGLILDSTHSRLAVPMTNRIRVDGYPFGEVGFLAIVLGAWMRTGVNVMSDDPITAIDDLGGRPVLLIHPGGDETIPVTDAEQVRDAARAAGVDARLVICPGAGHGRANDECPDEYQGWVDAFMDHVSAGG
jgi:pimeloyl-ACP methyl ester carboxylesterase